MKHTKKAKEWSDERFDNVVRNHKLVNYKSLKFFDKLNNRFLKLKYYLYLRLGFFDLKLKRIKKSFKNTFKTINNK